MPEKLPTALVSAESDSELWHTAWSPTLHCIIVNLDFGKKSQKCTQITLALHVRSDFSCGLKKAIMGIKRF